MSKQPIIHSFLAACIVLLFPLSTQAATSGTITVTGSVPVGCEITVNGTGNELNITDISVGDTDRHVATVVENCNDPDGYTVTMVGTNSSSHTGLFTDSVSSDTCPFTIKYGGTAVPSGGVVTDSNSPGNNVNKNVEITWASADSLTGSTAFTYAETLTFTISAK